MAFSGSGWGWREGSHPFTSLIGQELDALAVVSPCPVVPRHQLPAAIAVTATVGMACRSMGGLGQAERSGATEDLSSKSRDCCGPHPTVACLTFVIEVINVVRTGHGHHFTWCPQWPTQDVVPLRQAGAPCAHRDRQSSPCLVTQRDEYICAHWLPQHRRIVPQDWRTQAWSVPERLHGAFTSSCALCLPGLIAFTEAPGYRYWHWPYFLHWLVEAKRGECFAEILRPRARPSGAQVSLFSFCSWTHLPGVPGEGQVPRLTLLQLRMLPM